MGDGWPKAGPGAGLAVADGAGVVQATDHASGRRWPQLAMGGSRLGSLLASGGPGEAAAAVAAALEAGITLFDTADIYGQGSSELILGRALPRRGVEVCTKAGFVTPAPLWVLRLVKPVLRGITRRRGGVRAHLAQARTRSYPQRFDPAHLGRSLDGSLRRLRRERADMFLLHNPAPGEAGRDELWRWVEAELRRGRIGAFGVSCAGEPADRTWLEHAAVTVAQLPARAVLAAGPDSMARAPGAARLRIMVREVVGPGQHNTAAILDALRGVAATGLASAVVLGMSSARHVREVAALFPPIPDAAVHDAPIPGTPIPAVAAPVPAAGGPPR